MFSFITRSGCRSADTFSRAYDDSQAPCQGGIAARRVALP